MKKLLIIAFLCTLNVCAQDPIGKAILEMNSPMLEKLLAQRGPFSEIEKIKYLDLAQEVINELKMNAAIKKIRDVPESGLLCLGIVGIMVAPFMTTAYFMIEGYNFQRDGLKPILISVIANLAALFCCIKGAKNEIELQNIQQQHLRNAFNNKQLIYNK